MVISSAVGSVAVIPAPVNVNLVAPAVNVVDSSITVIDDPPPPPCAIFVSDTSLLIQYGYPSAFV